jgi:hypothetical protein
MHCLKTLHVVLNVCETWPLAVYIDRQTDRYIYRQTGRQAGRETDKTDELVDQEYMRIQF